ncbi:MAG: hypothetical protein ACPLQP_01610 [Moorellaceae bacterium]
MPHSIPLFDIIVLGVGYMVQQLSKSQQLLAFLQNLATLRRKRVTTYGTGDRVLWLADLPHDLPSRWKDACRSVFCSDNPEEMPDLWLEVRKKRRPELPTVPEEVKPWLPDKFLNKPEEYAPKDPEELLGLLRQKIGVITKRKDLESSATLDREWAPDEVVVWDKARVGKILRLIANRATSDAQVDEEEWKPLEWADQTFCIVLAPALVLRERRPTAYDELIARFLEAVENDDHFSTTLPWEQFVAEGESLSCPDQGESAVGSAPNNSAGRLYFPLHMNDEQKR